MNDLPPAWARVVVDDVTSEVRSGFASGKHNATGEGIAHLRPMNVSRLGEIDLTEIKYVDPAADERRLKPGDILFNNTNSPALVGKTALVRQVAGEQAFSNHMTRLRTVPGVVPAFLAAQLHYLWMTGRLSDLITNHVNQASISAKVLSKQVEVVLPPTAEQERIVAAIEECFSRLDAAEVSLRGARLRIGSLRTAVRAAWLTDQAGAYGVVPLTEKLGPSALFSDGDWVESKDQDPLGTVRLTQLADIGDGVWRDRSSRFMRQEQFDRLGCTQLEPRDVLVARMPDPLGRACLFPGDPRPCVTVVDVAIIRPGADGPCPEWLVPVLNSTQTRRQVSALQAGTTRKRISRRNLATVLVPDTPHHLQPELVGAVDEAEQQFKRTLDEISQMEGRNTALRRSILAAAFSGQLATQDSDDEPASVLLDRIRAERTASTSTKRTRKVKAS